MYLEEVRLQKWLAGCGVASRRVCEQLIIEKKVKVNGHTAKLGDKINPSKDVISILGKKIKSDVRGKKYYIMLNKPRGYITTMNDERDRKCVANLVKEVPVRLFPVGRLDKNSEGLLLMTNDGDFANRLSHPSSHIAKTYRVTVRSSVTQEQALQFSLGIMIDGKKTLPCKLKIILNSKERSVLEIILYEGRNRQIRKMCESVGLEVIRLKRIKIGQIKLGMLKVGTFRELTETELKSLCD